MDTDSKRPSPEEEDDSSDDQTSESEPELMVTTRARRTTAGNRYSTLVAQEVAEEQDEEDEVAMLFAEAEGEDEDFNSDEGDEDADLSSSDDDDQGPNAGVENMEGEEQIQKEAKVERARKRKADLALTTMAGIKKKPKIDPTALRRAAAPKPSKRKERVSWLPGSDAAPGRSSLRKQTILHRAETHAKMKENEEQRLVMKARREKREKEREAEAPKELTQADRLAEAGRVERRNAKSLNRWEAMEKKRAEEQAARLAALKERKLNGAVVTWYSSSARYLGPKEQNTEVETPPEGKKRGRKPKALLEQLAAAKLANSQQPILAPAQPNLQVDKDVLKEPPPLVMHDLTDVNPESQISSVGRPASDDIPKTVPENPQLVEEESMPQADQQGFDSDGDAFLTGIHEYASMPSQVKANETSPSRSLTGLDEEQAALSEAKTTGVDKQSNYAVKNSSQQGQPLQASMERDLGITSQANDVKPTLETVPKAKLVIPPLLIPETNKIVQNLDAEESSITNENPTKSKEGRQVSLQSQEDLTTIPAALESPQSHTSPMVIELSATSPAGSVTEPPIEVTSTRNLVILSQFDNLSDESRHDYGLFYNNRKTAKPAKHSQELCPVTGLTARYRDPATGIAYANAKAYKKLQELKQHQFAWSSMLSCYVGRARVVARGVPDGFLTTT